MDLSTTDPINYLVIGHITQDLLDDGTYSPGGTVSYSGLTAAALGQRVGILTSCSPDLELSAYSGLQVRALPASQSTVFRNIRTDSGRLQYMYHSARRLDAASVPEAWKNCPLVHLGLLRQKLTPTFLAFPKQHALPYSARLVKSFRARWTGAASRLDLQPNAAASCARCSTQHRRFE